MQQRHALYCLIWRWHFYAGLFCIPLIITLSLSGAIYLFKPQFDSWQEAPYQNLKTQAESTTAQQQIDAALNALPGAQFSNYQLPENEAQAVVIHLIHQGERKQLYVNPYTLEVLGIEATEDLFIRQVRTFHGELLAGDVGSIIVELAACWAIVLIISGLYLWWPRKSSGLAGVAYPRLSQGRRVFWRDLHAVCGIWISGMVLFLLISGLPWALVWGGALKELRQWNAAPIQQDWSQGRSAEHHKMQHQHIGKSELTQAVLLQAQKLTFAPPVLLAPNKKDASQWTVKSQSANRPLRADAWLDGQSGQVLRIEYFSDRPLLDRLIGIGVAAHEGQLFGWFNVFLGVLTTLGLLTISISGLVLWQQRKPQRVLGAPPVLPDAKAGKVVLAITLLLALFLPLLAVSLLIILILEKCLLSRWSVSRRWLGLS